VDRIDVRWPFASTPTSPTSLKCEARIALSGDSDSRSERRRLPDVLSRSRRS
jgi:hypothetical protein